MPEQHALHDGVAVDGVADGRDDVFVLVPVRVVEVVQYAAVVGGFHIVDVEAFHVCKTFGILGRQLGQIHFSASQLQGPGVAVGNDLKHDVFYVWLPGKIRVVGAHRDRLAGFPRFQGVRPRSDGMAEKVRRLHVFPFQAVLWQNRDRHIVDKRHVWLCQFENHGLPVGRLNGFDIHKVGRVFRFVVRIHDGFDRELHVFGRKWLTIVPRHVVSQMKRPCLRSLVVRPACRQGGHDSVVLVVGRQTVEQQQIDFAVLVDDRVDARIVLRRVNKGVGLFLNRFLAARQQSESQKPGNPFPLFLFHSTLPRFLFIFLLYPFEWTSGQPSLCCKA